VRDRGQRADLPLWMLAPILAILSANETTWYSIVASASPRRRPPELYLSRKLVRDPFMLVRSVHLT
jgi:hypothetical protein